MHTKLAQPWSGAHNTQLQTYQQAAKGPYRAFRPCSHTVLAAMLSCTKQITPFPIPHSLVLSKTVLQGMMGRLIGQPVTFISLFPLYHTTLTFIIISMSGFDPVGSSKSTV
jgi:hypothetical protein